MEQRAPLRRLPTRRLTNSRTVPPKDRGFLRQLAIQRGVLSNLPRGSADPSGPKLFVSILDSSSLEDATNNFSFQEAPQASCPDQHVPTASGQVLVSASEEWQRKLEAAEALLLLKASSPAPPGFVSQLQP